LQFFLGGMGIFCAILIRLYGIPIDVNMAHVVVQYVLYNNVNRYSLGEQL